MGSNQTKLVEAMVVLVGGAGLLLGWLLTIVIIRLPRERQFFRLPLHCTRTGEPLAWWRALPLVGWLVQRGRSRDGRPLHWVFPLVELLTAAAVLLLYQRYGLSPTFFYLTLVCALLLVTGAIDWLHRSIYTFLTLGGAMLVLLLSALAPQLTLVPIQNAVLGALVGGFTFLLLYMLARVLFPSMAAPFGLGDVYLAIFIGAAVGLTRLGTALVYGIFLAGIVAAGIVFAKHVLKRDDMPQYIAYGTYLCLGTLYFLVTGGL